MNTVLCGSGFSLASKSVFWEANPAKQGNPATLFSEHLDRNCLTVRTKIAAGSRGTRPAGCRHLGDKILNVMSNNTHSSAASGSRLPHWFLMKEGTWRGSPGRSGPPDPGGWPEASGCLGQCLSASVQFALLLQFGRSQPDCQCIPSRNSFGPCVPTTRPYAFRTTHSRRSSGTPPGGCPGRRRATSCAP